MAIHDFYLTYAMQIETKLLSRDDGFSGQLAGKPWRPLSRLLIPESVLGGFVHPKVLRDSSPGSYRLPLLAGFLEAGRTVRSSREAKVSGRSASSSSATSSTTAVVVVASLMCISCASAYIDGLCSRGHTVCVYVSSFNFS